MFGRAAAQGQDGLGPVDQVRDDLAFQLAEGGLAVRGEDLPDRASRPLFDDQVAVDEREAEALGEQVADGGLPGAHEADQDDHGSAFWACFLACSPTSSAMACRASW
jgi:hypothetical protein